MPYTAFYAKKSFIDDNEDLIKRFNNAINRGLDYVRNNNEKNIANAILSILFTTCSGVAVSLATLSPNSMKIYTIANIMPAGINAS